MFTDKVVPISVNYPFFFKPTQDGMDRPKTELAYRVPATKYTRRKLTASTTDETLQDELQGLDTTIDWNKVIFNMLTLKGIYGREMYETWYKMSVMIESGLDVSPVVTHRLPFAEFKLGFDVMNSGEASKVILNWES